MTIVDQTTLLQRANQVRTETAGFANTASRLGGLFRDIIDSLFGSSELSVASFGAYPSNSAAANDTAIAAAIASAVANNSGLFWPYGAYAVSASVANLHSVRHRGPGRITRGSDTFYVDPRFNQTNTLYVSSSGSSSNDGLTSALPMVEPQNAFDALRNYGPVLNGSWVISQAAGTITNKPVSVSGLRSRSRILWKGPAASYGTPTAIMDGTGATADGARFQDFMYLTVQDIKFQNWTGTSASGLVTTNATNLYAVNVHAANCDFLGIGVTAGVMYVEGGVVSGCDYGIQAYSQTAFNIGYNGHAPSVSSCALAGIHLRDNSSGDLIGATVSNNTAIGVKVLHQSRVKLNSCTIQNNGTYGVICQIFSTAQDEASNTVSSNPSGDWVYHWSIPLDAEAEYNYDEVNVRHGWGVVTPQVKYHFRKTSVSTAYSASAAMALEDTNPVISLSSDGNGFAGIYAAKASNASIGQFTYVFADNSWRFVSNNATAYRLNPTSFTAETDNTSDIGSSAIRWRQTWAVLRYYSSGVFDSAGSGTPEGAVTANVGSTYRRTNGGAGTSFYVKESGTGNTGWVAK